MLNKELIVGTGEKPNPYAPYHFVFTVRNFSANGSFGWLFNGNTEGLPYWGDRNNFLTEFSTYDDGLWVGTNKGVDGERERAHIEAFEQNGVKHFTADLFFEVPFAGWTVVSGRDLDHDEGAVMSVTFAPPPTGFV